MAGEGSLYRGRPGLTFLATKLPFKGGVNVEPSFNGGVLN